MKMILLSTVTMLSVILMFNGCGNGTFNDAKLDVPKITVTSASIVEGKLVNDIVAEKENNSPNGKNESPEVSWESVDGANYYAVIMFDETANWLHLFVTNIISTEIEQGKYTDVKTYIGPYPPKSSGVHTYRIEVFAIKDQPKDTIGKLDAKNSYSGIVNHLNQVGGNSDNILARGYITGNYQNTLYKGEDSE